MTESKDKWLIPYEIKAVGTGEKLTVHAGTINRLINPHASLEECTIFLNMCRSYGANPFLKDLHLVKYAKDQRDPAEFVAGIGFFEKKAQTNPKFKGYGKTLYMNDKGEWKDIFIAKKFGFGQYPVAARAFCYVDGFVEIQERTTGWDECAGKKRDGTVNASWKKQPGVMLEKVAKVRLLRGVFSSELGGLYSIDEMGSDSMQNKNPENQPTGLTGGTTSFSQVTEYPDNASETQEAEIVEEETPPETEENNQEPENNQKSNKKEKKATKKNTQKEKKEANQEPDYPVQDPEELF